jgi:hypothetical protein
MSLFYTAKAIRCKRSDRWCGIIAFKGIVDAKLVAAFVWSTKLSCLWENLYFVESAARFG